MEVKTKQQQLAKQNDELTLIKDKLDKDLGD